MEDGQDHIFVFAAESAADLNEWLRFLKHSADNMPTMRFGASYGVD